jgi:hypothetical protein
MDMMKCLDVVPLFDVLGRFALRCFISFIVIAVCFVGWNTEAVGML